MVQACAMKGQSLQSYEENAWFSVEVLPPSFLSSFKHLHLMALSVAILVVLLTGSMPPPMSEVQSSSIQASGKSISPKSYIERPLKYLSLCDIEMAWPSQ